MKLGASCQTKECWNEASSGSPLILYLSRILLTTQVACVKSCPPCIEFKLTSSPYPNHRHPLIRGRSSVLRLHLYTCTWDILSCEWNRRTNRAKPFHGKTYSISKTSACTLRFSFLSYSLLILFPCPDSVIVYPLITKVLLFYSLLAYMILHPDMISLLNQPSQKRKAAATWINWAWNGTRPLLTLPQFGFRLRLWSYMKMSFSSKPFLTDFGSLPIEPAW